MIRNSATIVRQPQFGSISPISDSESFDSEITTSAIPTSPSTPFHVTSSIPNDFEEESDDPIDVVDQSDTVVNLDHSDSDDPLNIIDQPDGNFAHFARSGNCPQTYKQACNSGEWEHWNAAIKDELSKMRKYNVWQIIDYKPGMRVVGAKWVFKIDGETGKPAAY